MNTFHKLKLNLTLMFNQSINYFHNISISQHSRTFFELVHFLFQNITFLEHGYIKFIKILDKRAQSLIS